MTDKVYSFTKIRKQHTKSGVYALAGGLFSIAVLLFFIGFGIYKGGNMHGIFCLIPYLTMFGSLIGMIAAQKDIRRTDVAGEVPSGRAEGLRGIVRHACGNSADRNSEDYL